MNIREAKGYTYSPHAFVSSRPGDAYWVEIADVTTNVTGPAIGEVFADHGLTQLRIAETEKYAHVTYFFNGGREEPFDGEERLLVQSPQHVATYDEAPEMSADGIRQAVVDGVMGFVVVWKLWGWRPATAAALIIPFVAVDTIFFSANLLKLMEGAWVPLLFGVASIVFGWYWTRRYFGRVAALLLAALLTFSPAHYTWSATARGYPALLFFALLSTALYFDYLQEA